MGFTVPSTELGMSWKLGWCLATQIHRSLVSELLVSDFLLLLVLLTQYLFTTIVLVILNYYFIHNNALK